MAHSSQIETPLPFRILFEDQHLLVLSKPANLLSQGDHSGEASLVDLLRTYFGRNYVGLIHRLDRNTTGLMIVAKRSKSAERLTKQLQKGELTRTYHAILYGELTNKTPLRWEHWLLKNEKTNEVKSVNAKTAGAKPASLLVTPLRNFKVHDLPVTLAKFELETGRSHQIRVQALASGHPLIGDSKYGNAKSVSLFSRPALHSAAIEFFHPITREKLRFEEIHATDMLASFPMIGNS